MKLLLILVLVAMALAQTRRLTYPQPPKGNQVDDYNGVKIADPYRSLEDADAPTTKKFVEDQNKLTQSWLAQVPVRDRIRKELTSLWNYERYSGMFRAGKRYLYYRNSGLQNQSVLYVSDTINGTARVLIDPNTWKADGTAALAGVVASQTGKYVAYAIEQAGADWQEWHVRDIATGKDLPDTLKWCKGDEPAWLADDSGLYYSRFPEPKASEALTVASLNQKVYFHKMGDPQSADKLVYERPDNPNWSFSAIIPEDSHYLILSMFTGEYGKNQLALQDLAIAGAKPADLIGKTEFAYSPIGISGSALYVQTNDHAPRGRVILIDLKRPDRSAWKEVIAETTDTLESVQMADGKLLLAYMKDAHSAARLVNLDGKTLANIEMPGMGTAGWSGAQLNDKEMFFNFTGYTMTPGVYRLDLATYKTNSVHQGKSTLDAAAYETKQVFYSSKDGTKIPMFLSYKKGIKLDGSNSTLLYGYGGFDIATTPGFSPQVAEWMQMGGVFASANMRGGSEYGEAWHEAGMRAKKQNVFDDFIAAAEWLIANKYTSTPKLGINGRSNGGLLIGAVLNQRPDLFGAAIPEVGVMDMLRFNRFGWGTQWVGEYGDPGKKEDFPIVRAYSPLHNIKNVAYPPTLVTTSDHDDRVMPGHSLKYTATLQQAQQGANPILLRVETQAGHGAGTPTSKQIDATTDRLSFLYRALKMK